LGNNAKIREPLIGFTRMTERFQVRQASVRIFTTLPPFYIFYQISYTRTRFDIYFLTNWTS